ncbi:hypothetical protein BX666DRAFT_2123666 [Dichotomocladium elegans]|nr:hypothetical protein BX666DRAFT_2123666 [Dichotomocladium elegans]
MALLLLYTFLYLPRLLTNLSFLSLSLSLDMTSYWYSTDGLNQRRLPNTYLDILDHAYRRRTRVEIIDDEAFGSNVAAVADPFLGTMTAGDIHYGLYRNPSLHRMSDGSSSIDTLILFDSTSGILQQQQQQQQQLVIPRSSSPPLSASSTPNRSIGRNENCLLMASHLLLGGRRPSLRNICLAKPSSLATTGVDHQHHTLRTQSQEECGCCIIS